LALIAVPAQAGPPYETDDPQPTERTHWEIYTFGTREGSGNDVAGVTGVDLNYGPVDGVQLTATLPLAYARGNGATFGDIEIGIKYRFVHDEHTGLDIAMFPRVILPTAGRGFGTGRASLLLPIWVQKSFGRWAVFGGGGYTINPGVGQRNFASGAIAVTRSISGRLSLGIEGLRTGPDADDARASTSLGIGAIMKLDEHLSLLASGGPIFEDGSHRAQYRLYTGLGIQF
jgi:hypothetical protein